MRYLIAIALSLSIPAGVAAQDTPSPATGAATPAADPGQAIQCRRYPVTGSLAQTRRICHTRAEWTRMSRNANEELLRTIGDRNPADPANPPGP